MTEQWQELKETITEMRDNDGTSTQQEVCRFLVNYMETLEKQMQESIWIPVSVYNYLEYTVNTMVDNINAEVTLDVIKNMAGKKDE